MDYLGSIDHVRLHFNRGSLVYLDLSLALIMFGVALDIVPGNFKWVLLRPKAILTGLSCQYIFLPFLTFIIALIISPMPSIALGMILVACCPSGNIANFLTQLSKGNTELSVTLNAFASLLAVFLIPVNFAFYGHQYLLAKHITAPVSMNGWQMVRTVCLLMGLPLLLGILFRHFMPKLTVRILKPMKIFSIFVFGCYVAIALGMNISYFLKYWTLIVLLVFIHNTLVMSTGYLFSRTLKLSIPDRKTITIESGIHNAGLALVLIFDPKLFNGMGGMAIIAAWWGIWHILSGLTVAAFFSKWQTI